MKKIKMKPIRTKRAYEAAMEEIERLWGARLGTPDGDRLDMLASLIEAYEAARYPIGPSRRRRTA